MSNNHIELNYKKWYNFSKIITNNKESQDLLHDLIIRFKDVPDIKATDNYVFISLRNLFLERIRVNKIDSDVDVSNFEDNSLEDLELTQMIIEDIIKQKKLDCISETVSKLNHFEKKLYQLHFIFGISQRKIAREIGVNHLTINLRINKIKEKIKNNYEFKN